MPEPVTRQIFPAASYADRVADWIMDFAAANTGRVTLALSGGSTPKPIFERLALPERHRRIPWDRVFVFWGDERMVPPDHPDSNYRMARQALLDHVPIPPAQIFPMPTGIAPEQAARDYQALLQTHYGAGTLDPARPLFDLQILGLGTNGHTASLFPDTPALEEQLAWVTPVTTGVPQPRLTLTYPAIASSRVIAFLVEGSAKRDVTRRVLDGDRSLPAARIAGIGRTIWFLDEDAAP